MGDETVRPLENYQIVMRKFEADGWRDQATSVRDLAYAMRAIIRYDEEREPDRAGTVLRGALNLLEAGENMADGCSLSYEECVALRRLLRSGELRPVFVLQTTKEWGGGSKGRIVGVFATPEKAESYKRTATPPIEDGVIEEWGVE